MSKAMSGQLASDTLDVAHLFFVNMSLLGFDAAAMEKRYRIPFNKDMFALPNKKGFEVVIYFLFNRLDTVRCREMFRDCWPITDKKEEQQFRKVCTSWLEQIVKDDPDSHLPRIGASLFMSPGGDKFYQFLFFFSRYVMFRIIVCEHGARCPADFPGHPLLTPSNSTLAVSMANTSAASGTVLQQRFIKGCQQLETLQDEWVTFADELTKEYRGLVRHCRDLEHELKTELHKMSESKLSIGNSPRRPRHHGGSTEYDHEIQTVQRAQAVQQVRGLWKSVEEFYTAVSNDKEVVESILHRTVEKYRIDATEMSITLPDMLLRECEQEIQRRNVDNVYKEGKVNLLSLVHLWNLSLHLYIEKMHEVGLPNLDEYIAELQTMLHTHRSHLSSAESHKKSLEFEILPEVKDSVEQLKNQFHDELRSNAGHRTSLCLMPPTPPVSFEPQDSSDLHKHHSDVHLRLKHGHDTTPDGATQILADIDNKLRKKHDLSLVQGQPIYGQRIKGSTVRPLIAGPGCTQQSNGTRKQEDMNVKQLTQSQRPSQQVLSTTPYISKPAAASQARVFPAAKVGTRNKLESSAASRGSKTLTSSKVANQKHHHHSSQKSNVPVDRHENLVTYSTAASDRSATRHMNLLIDRVVSAVMSNQPENDDDAGNEYQFDPVTELGTEMFQPGDKISRTPPSSVSKLQPDVNSGPLSSTHIDSGSTGHSWIDPPVDPVAIRLFDPPIAATAMPSSFLQGEPMSHRQQIGKAVDITPLHSDGSPPSSIHSVSTRDGSDNSFSGDDHLSLSILDSISGRTRDRVLAADSGPRERPMDIGHRLSQEHSDVLLDLGLDCLDETIQFLLDSKTPMLPTRVRSAISSKPVVNSHDNMKNSSVVYPLTRTLSSIGDTHLSNSTRRETTTNSQNSQSCDVVHRQTHVSANTAVQTINSSLPSRVNESSKPLESLADLDSLIARYRNLRAVAEDTVAEQPTSSFDLNSNVKTDTTPTLSTLNLPTVATDRGFTSPRNVRVDSTASNNIAGTNTSFNCGLLDSPAIINLSTECGLDNDEFEDIHQNLVNMSLDDDLSLSLTPRLQQKGAPVLDTSQTLFHSMPMSPFTDAVHSTSHVQSSVIDPTRFEVTSRISDILGSDILRENSSVLVPSSPAGNSRTSVQTANLVDLS